MPNHSPIICAAAEHTTLSSANHAFMLQVAMVGRPNVGKSSLMNSWTGIFTISNQWFIHVLLRLLQVAIVGRPNVGKSHMMNSWTGVFTISNQRFFSCAAAAGGDCGAAQRGQV
jgi:GTP-binding protein EngB required for normal cell division